MRGARIAPRNSCAAQFLRYVRDYLNGSTANTENFWVEIEVWGSSSTVFVGNHYELEANLNLAQGKTATQSSTHASGAVASRAVDGNTDGNFGNGSVTHTNNDYHAWRTFITMAQRITASVTLRKWAATHWGPALTA